MDHDTMIGKRLTIRVVVAVLVVSIAGAGTVTTGVLAAGMDGNDSQESATEMATNSTETGTIESDDVDWYAFDVEAGEQMNVGLVITTDNEKNLHFDIFGPNGEETEEGAPGAMRPPYSTQRMISGPGAGGGDVAEQSGTHYVRVEGEGPTDYNLTVETRRLDQYEPNEQPASATSIESGETISAVMSGLDQDTYAVDLEKGETINVTASHDSYGLVNTQLVGPSASNETIHNYHNDYVVTDESPEADRFNHTANRSGTYFIRVYPVEHGMGSFDKNASYELSVTGSGADEDDGSSDGTEDDSGTDDAAETTDDTGSTDENDSTGAPDTTDTEQSDSGGSVDDTDDGASTDTQADDTEQTSQSGPGFTGGGAVIGLLVTALFALRRR